MLEIKYLNQLNRFFFGVMIAGYLCLIVFGINFFMIEPGVFHTTNQLLFGTFSFIVIGSLVNIVVIQLSLYIKTKSNDYKHLLLQLIISLSFFLPLLSFDLYYIILAFHANIDRSIFFLPAYTIVISILLLIKTFKFIFFRELYPLHVNPNPKLYSEFDITKREQEIIIALVNGLSYQEISSSLYISISTVKTHVMSIYSKLNINKREELIQLLFNP